MNKNICTATTSTPPPHFLAAPRKKINSSLAKGFTLIELLVVVLIIGILAAVALPQYTRAVDRSRLSEALINVKALKGSMDRYKLETGQIPLTFDELDLDWNGTTSAGDGTWSNQVMVLGKIKYTILANGSARATGTTANLNSVILQFRDNNAIVCYAMLAYIDKGRPLCQSLGGVRDASSDVDNAEMYRIQ